MSHELDLLKIDESEQQYESVNVK